MLGANLTYAKAYNYRLVLEIIRLHGPISRAAIARQTGLTAQTVSNITRNLLENNLISQSARFQEGRGAPSTALIINPQSAYSIGFDLDQDHLTGILMALDGTVQRRVSFVLDLPGPEEAMDLMEKATSTLLSDAGLIPNQVWGVGIGLPGPLEITEGSVVTNVVNPKAFPGWSHVPVVETMSKRLSLPIHLENNATAAAIGERWYGGGQHIESFFYMFFGLGLGGGLILNGHPFTGHSGNAGEIGYIPIGYKHIPSPFTRPHIGIHFNLPQLYNRLRSTGNNVERPAQLATIFESKNQELNDWLEEGAKMLAPLILAVEYLLDPEAIFLGGRIPDEILGALLSRINEELPALRIEDKTSQPALQLAEAGNDAAALGVATIPLYESFAPSHAILSRRAGERQTTPFSSNDHPTLNL